MNHLQELIQNKEVEKAMEEFNSLDKPISQFNYSQFAKWLQEAKYTNESIKVLKEGLQNYPQNTFLVNAIVPKIYNTILKPYYDEKSYTESQYLATISYIDRILPKQYKNNYAYIYLKHVDYLLKKSNPDKATALNLLLELNGNSLEKKDFIINETSYPSNFEKWVTKKSKLEFELGEFSTCIETVDFALQQNLIWHNKQDIWLKRLKALSLAGSQNYEEAINIHLVLVAQNPTWFMYHELARFYKEKNQFDEALFYGVKACISKDADHSKCGKLFLTLIGVFEELEESSYPSFLHLSYLIEIYTKHEFRINSEIQDKYNKLSVEYNLPKNIKKELENYWLKVIYDKTPITIGTIKRILPDGRNGFIEKTSGDQIFFKFSSLKFSKNKAIVGKKVSFIVSESFDSRRQKKSLIAELIYEVKG